MVTTTKLLKMTQRPEKTHLTCHQRTKERTWLEGLGSSSTYLLMCVPETRREGSAN